jgi:hypothetical protein
MFLYKYTTIRELAVVCQFVVVWSYPSSPSYSISLAFAIS